MADISMCLREDCIRKLLCHRYTAPFNKFGQSIIHVTDDRMKDCDLFYDNKGYTKDEKFNDTNTKDKTRTRRK